jgi:hypothetical protein
MNEGLNSADQEFLRLVHEGREEEARQFAVEHIRALSPDVRDDVLDSLSDEGLEPDILKEEEEIMKKRQAG